MRIRVPQQTIDDWLRRLTRAGLHEIGGVLFGEQICEGTFRIVTATCQRSWPRSHNAFRRRGAQARRDVLSLHRRYGEQPERFNYLGEWHSHPNAAAIPSLRDEMTMFDLLADQRGAVNFLVLMIVRISQAGLLEIGARSYLASGHVLPCAIALEDRGDEEGSD